MNPVLLGVLAFVFLVIIACTQTYFSYMRLLQLPNSQDNEDTTPNKSI